MDTKQLHSILIELEAAGLRPQIGIYKEENSMTSQLSLKVCDSGPRPDEGISLNNYINVNVTDNSMRSSGFKEGDVINVKLNDYYFDGAVVLARVHDGIGLCAYCRDDEHNPWLIPRNEKYAPIEIESEERIIGRAVSVVSRDPKISVSIRCIGVEQALRYANILLDIADGTKRDFDELFIERNMQGRYWIHFAVRPKENRRKISFLQT